MGHWQRRPTGQVRVFVCKDGKKSCVPRKLVAHLDSEPDHNIEAWIEEYERRLGIEKALRSEITDLRLLRLVERYCAYLGRRKSEKTVRQHRSCLLYHVLPFLVAGDPPAHDPNQWPPRAPKLLEHLESKGIGGPTIRVCNVALRKFWGFLQDEGVVLASVTLRLRPPVIERRKTPLKRKVEPAEVLKWARECRSDEVKLMGLLGYFFSLRPQETFALMPSDFRAGSSVSGLDCCKSMAKLGMFSRLAVNVTRQRSDSGVTKDPKVDSKGWVACFDGVAAKMVVELLKDRKPDEALFTAHNRTLFHRWSEGGIKDVTLKDLRRASLYWLGHNSGIQPVELMKHARHVDFETTTLYLRRPEERIEESTNYLDLDA